VFLVAGRLHSNIAFFMCVSLGEVLVSFRFVSSYLICCKSLVYRSVPSFSRCRESLIYHPVQAVPSVGYPVFVSHDTAWFSG
jgi:hypothetical protein